MPGENRADPMPIDFPQAFKALTGCQPMSWQTRLYEQHFAKGDLPPVVDIPTGLGKTMVMAIWLIARAAQPNKVPTRLIYVVDRRTVVDQASDLAKKLQDNCNQALGIEPPAISTLRGRLADNREWSRDPSRPAIIIGTVDLIGSALLFSGYRSSFKRRPLEAGLLGQDSLLVLDEAHLSRPFEKLIGGVGKFQEGHGKPMRVIRMSATVGEDTSQPFQLNDSDFSDSVVTQRFTAQKRLTIRPAVDPKKINDALASAAIELANDTELLGKRIVVFVRKPDDATKIAEAIRKHGGTKTKQGPFADSVRILTGTMRGLERDELVEQSVFKHRWLNGALKPDDPENQSPVFLISTSAGEVGFDLNADHLVGDEAPLDSWIQRLGRVNRRGSGDAKVLLISRTESAAKNDFDKACIVAVGLLSDGMNVSPKALAAFKESLSVEQVIQASTPKPDTVELTDILLDAWSLTSIIEPMPGRPEVGPWLRGIADDLPQTAIAWRAELDLPDFAELEPDAIGEWFDAHRILAHETLSVPTSVAAKQLLARWNVLEPVDRLQLGECLVIVERAGQKTVSVLEFIAALERDDRQTNKAYDSIRNAELILPASFGGIERHVGLLDPSAPKKLEDTKDADVADMRGRYRELITKSQDGENLEASIGSGSKPANRKSHVGYTIVLASDDDKRVTLASYIPRSEKPEFGRFKPETLASHVGAVGAALCDITREFERTRSSLLSDDLQQAAKLAADFHDHGKARERWQRLLVFPRDFVRPDEPMGKSGKEMKRDSRGYRHEFGSLCAFTDAFHAGKLIDNAGNPINQDAFDLAMHLIATHHGRGRPHFSRGGFDPDCETQSDSIHAESIRRFARLQRKYGWWHLAWLENLLRCADQLASADEKVTEIDKLEGVES